MRRFPHLVGGRSSGDTLLMREIPGLLVKLGADGVQASPCRTAGPPPSRSPTAPSGRGSRSCSPRWTTSEFAPRRLPLAPLAVAGRTVLGAGRPVGSVVAAPDLFH